jgi:N-acetylglutamate synthase-like GNAT family acetyltransferase
MKIRPARGMDVPAIHTLIARCAGEGLLLPRAREEIREHIGEFLILVNGNKMAGCVALDSYTSDLAEIRSLAVHPQFRGSGHASRLLAFALQEARRRGIAHVFAVTHAPALFVRAGFSPASRMEIPEKIERDCCSCPEARSCRLVALMAVVAPGATAFPIFRERDAVLTSA